VLHNLRLKLFALLMAILLWTTFHLATKQQASGTPLFPSGSQTNQVPH
jgi:hypothetical protein